MRCAGLIVLVLVVVATGRTARADCPDCRQHAHPFLARLTGADNRTATVGPNGNRPRTAFMYRYTECYGIHYTPPLNYRLQMDYPWHSPVRSMQYAAPEATPHHVPAPPVLEGEAVPPGAMQTPHEEALPAPSARRPRRSLLR